MPQNPKARRPRAIWLRPDFGPHVVSTPWNSAPSPLPSRIAATACQKLSPNTSTAMAPTKTVANSMFGEVHIHSSWRGRPCRSDIGIGLAPPGSTATAFVPYSGSSWSGTGRAVVAVDMGRSRAGADVTRGAWVIVVQPDSNAG